MSSPATSNIAIRSVIGRDGHCVGFVMRRRRNEIEAFGVDETTVGIFDSEPKAVAAAIEKSGAAKQ